MNKKKVLCVAIMLAGIGLSLAGLLVFNTDETHMAYGLCIGLGAAFFGLGTGWLIHSLTVSPADDEKIQKKKAIEVNDERNTRIRERTGYMAAKIMNYVLSVFVLVLGFMGVAPTVIIMAISLIVIQFVLLIYFSNYYAKVM